ncbi:hypothetical protein N5J75_00400 [Pantoea brenneri]|uniref:hypothetical protein n=1 Tax=Pantoea brenneri TaxID=472694 RepID=UPI002446E524|nr:hypothetical protein [Pantoea brenneri]MDH2121668.1 hypothetical protein [Pantoea brenneri]
MENEKFIELSLNLDSLGDAATEICKVKAMLGLLLTYMPPEVQQSYFQRLRDAGLDNEINWLQQMTNK